MCIRDRKKGLNVNDPVTAVRSIPATDSGTVQKPADDTTNQTHDTKTQNTK